MSDLCQCGCGEVAPAGKRFKRGHWSRTAESKAMRERMRKPMEVPNPSGLCLCGCGERTPLATRNRPSRGEAIGHPLRYLSGHNMRGKSGPETSRWKGGRWVHKGGYVYIHTPGHPAANRDNYVYEHRLVAERTIGRYLKSNEHVHHINGIKTDNRPENLVVLTKSEHHRLHGTAELERYHAAHPDAKAASGRKGAQARWKKAE